MELTFLGTSAMVPTKDRNHASVYLEHEGVGILFDCGEGTQRQLRIAGISPAKIRIICITHWHGDHALGLVGLLQTMGASHNEHEVTLIGPAGTSERIASLMEIYPAALPYTLNVIDAEQGSHRFSGFRIASQPLMHVIPNLGFAFVEDDSRVLEHERIKREKIRDGPWLGRLQKGQDAEYDGRTLPLEDYTRLRKGRKVSYVTDTSYCKEAVELARNSDVLICESTFTSEHDEKSLAYDHMTAQQAAQLAVAAGVSRLVLTHFSQRYTRVDAFLEEAQAVFPDTRAAYDFMKLSVKRSA